MHLVPLLADTASTSALAHVEKQRLTGGELNHKLGHYFVINQSDNRRQVSRDVTALMEKLGDRLLGIIHRDEAWWKRMLPRSRSWTLTLLRSRL